MANVQDAIAFMREIKALGCRFALDDFGRVLHLPISSSCRSIS